MATDNDRFANVLDNRFNKIAFRIRTGTPDAVHAVCDHIVGREKDADPRIGDFFMLLHRLRTRREVPLFADKDPSSASIEARARESSPARRLAEAYASASETGDDLALALAKRRVRWIEGCLETQQDWPDARSKFDTIKAELIKELAAHHRGIYLGIGELQRAAKSKAANQDDLVHLEFPANP